LLVAVFIVVNVVARLTCPFLVTIAISGLTAAACLGYAMTRRGAFRIGLAVFAFGALANAAVVLANGAMPVAERPEALALAPDQVDEVWRSIEADPKYELVTASTRVAWLGDTIPLPHFRGLASPGDLLLWVSIPFTVIALAHLTDGRGGTGRRLSRRRFRRRFDRAAETWDADAAQREVDAGLRAWPGDPIIRFHALIVPVLANDFRASADRAVAALAEGNLSEWHQGQFLWGYADALLMCDPPDLEGAEAALAEAEVLRPGEITQVTTRALLAMRRGEMDEAAAGARYVLSAKASGEAGKATLILLEALLTQYELDGRASTELVGAIRSVVAMPNVAHDVRYTCALAAYQSHAGEHAAAVAVLRDAARLMPDPNHPVEAVHYHLAYVLARTGDAASIADIERLLDSIPPHYPSPSARAHTTALRHLTAGDPAAALTAVAEALEDGALTPAHAAEVHLTRAAALGAMGREPEAAESRAGAMRLAPHHQLLEA
jgi:hypothetical protein